MSVSSPRKQVLHRHGVPDPAARCADAAGVQGRGDGAQRGGAAGLDLAHHRQDVGGEGIGRGLVGGGALRLGFAQVGPVA